MFQKAFDKTTKYHGLNGGGMEQIIDKLSEHLTSNSIHIRLNTECIDIVKTDNKYICKTNDNIEFVANNIVFAIPKANLLKINFLDAVKSKLNTVIHKPLIRIYAFFPVTDNHVWFENITTGITMDTPIRQLIPIDSKKGIIMIYCDDNAARSWYYLYKKNILRTELMFHLRKIFTDIPEPLEIYTSYHDTATHIWKPTIDSNKMYDKIIKPMINENIYIVGEAYSLTQQWSQGAIETVNDFMKII
jgi:monoamine oxidase